MKWIEHIMVYFFLDGATDTWLEKSHVLQQQETIKFLLKQLGWGEFFNDSCVYNMIFIFY